MTDRAALYTVSVRARAKRSGPLPLGDIDDAGTSLLGALSTILGGFSQTSKDGTRIVRSLVVEVDGDDLFVIVQHGRKGIAADIVDPAGAVRLRQRPDDVQLVRCGCLFRLPAAATAGELAVHVSNGRGIKGLVDEGLVGRFRSAYPGLTLTLDRLAEPGALREAVASDRVEKVRLVRVEPPGPRARAGTGKWVDPGVEARVQLEVAVKTKGMRLNRSLLERYLGGESAALAEIVAFGDLSFDEVLVGVVLPDGTRRFFDLARPEAGRPASRELPALELDADGEPTAASLLTGLRAALESSRPGSR